MLTSVDQIPRVHLWGLKRLFPKLNNPTQRAQEIVKNAPFPHVPAVSPRLFCRGPQCFLRETGAERNIEDRRETKLTVYRRAGLFYYMPKLRSGAHNTERTTSMFLCHGVLSD